MGLPRFTFDRADKLNAFTRSMLARVVEPRVVELLDYTDTDGTARSCENHGIRRRGPGRGAKEGRTTT
jgi:hypothetical protein